MLKKYLIIKKQQLNNKYIKVGTAVANIHSSTGNNNYRCVTYGSYIYLIF